MALDWDTVVGAGSAVLVANLPYNVATPLVADVLDGVAQIERMLVMVQREVGERFVAAPRTRAYGAVSVKIAYWATARIVGLVPAVGVRAPAQRRVGARRDRPPTAAGHRSCRPVPARPHGVQPAAQDAPAFARRRRGAGAVRRRRRSSRRRVPRSSTSTAWCALAEAVDR